MLKLYGAAVTGASADVLIKKCTFNRNTSAGVGSGFNSGFAAQNGQTTNLVFDSCQFNGTNTTVSDHDIAFFFGEHGGTSSLGITMFNATNVTFNNCEAHGISLTLNTAMTPTFPPLNGSTTVTQGFFIEFCNNVTLQTVHLQASRSKIIAVLVLESLLKVSISFLAIKFTYQIVMHQATPMVMHCSYRSKSLTLCSGRF